jgi:hypothetical protein
MYFSCIRACIFLQLLYSLRNSPRQETGWLLTAFMTVLTVYFMTVLKVHKHEIILNFFLPKSNSYMPFVNFEKNFASFPSIFTRISMIEHFRGDWAYAEPNFFWEVSKIFFLQNLHFGPIRWVHRRFFKIQTILSHGEHTRNRFHRMLSILGTNFRACSASGKMWTFLHVQSMLSIRRTNFIAHWAYREPISSHAEHTGNRFHRMLSMRRNV